MEETTDVSLPASSNGTKDQKVSIKALVVARSRRSVPRAVRVVGSHHIGGHHVECAD